MNQPTVLGHEIAGVVDEVGSNSNFQVGDHVVSLHWAQYHGDAFPSPFQHKLGMKTFLGLTCDGGYADYLSTHETAFVKLSSSISSQWTSIDAAPIMSTFGTVWQGAMIRGKLQKNEKVLITGASGGVGSAAVRLTSTYGCHVIGTTSSIQSKGQYIQSLGAREVVDATTSYSKAIGSTCDMVIECVGAPTFNESLKCLKPGGRLILIGNVTNSTAPLPLGMCIVKSLNVIGTDSIEANELSTLFEWLTKKSLRPEIHQVIGLNEREICEAHELLEKRGVTGRIVIDVNSQIW